MGGGGCLYIDCVGVFDSGAPHQPSGQGKKIILQWSIFIPPGFVLVEGNPFTLCRKCLVMTSNCILESALHCLMWGVNHQGVWGVIRFGFIVHLVPLICWHIVIGGSWHFSEVWWVLGVPETEGEEAEAVVWSLGEDERRSAAHPPCTLSSKTLVLRNSHLLHGWIHFNYPPISSCEHNLLLIYSIIQSCTTMI